MAPSCDSPTISNNAPVEFSPSSRPSLSIAVNYTTRVYECVDFVCGFCGLSGSVDAPRDVPEGMRGKLPSPKGLTPLSSECAV